MAAGTVTEIRDDFDSELGQAVIAMKMWAEDEDDAFTLFQAVCSAAAFKISGNIDLYKTDPEVPPPNDASHAYGINFTPFSE